MLLLFIGVNRLTDFYIKKQLYHSNLSKLETYHNIIKVLVTDHLNYIIATSDKSEPDALIATIKEFIKNYIFVPKPSVNNYNLPSNFPYLTIQELLNEISGQIFNYYITINDQLIISNNSSEFKDSLTDQYKIGKNLLLRVSIQINPHAIEAQEAKSKIDHYVLINNVISACIFLIIVKILFLFFMKEVKLRKKLNLLEIELDASVKRNKNILLFKNINKEFLLKCYQYSKTIFSNNSPIHIGVEANNSNREEEYFPIPLIVDQENNAVHQIGLQPIITELYNYFEGYMACHNTKIKLNIRNEVETISTPFAGEIFTQIIFSIFYNVLSFNKNTETTNYIELIFKEEKIIYISNGFRLDHHLAVRYSEKIFNETGNVFILSLGQVFALFKRYKLEYTVIAGKDHTNIEVKLRNNVQASNNSSSKGQIINLSEFKR